MHSVRFGVVGYGAGGRLFHTPFIEAAAGCKLVGVVARSDSTRQLVNADYPNLPVFESLDQMLAAGEVDVIVVSTPPATHEAIILEAIAAGVAVVGDKPFAPDPDTGRRLAAAADRAGVLLNAYHNRRWDADIQTLKTVLDSGEVGEPQLFESRFDLYEPHTVEAGPGGGVLSDLGSHLIDQALWLFGPAQRVYGELQPVQVNGRPSDGGFFVAIRHASGVVSHLGASKLNRVVGRELRLTGTRGSFRSCGTDVQAVAIAAGRRPVNDGDRWGYEKPEHWGSLTTDAGERRVSGAQGRYQAFYEKFAAATRGKGHPPVPADQAIDVLTIIEAARQSALSKQVVIPG